MMWQAPQFGISITSGITVEQWQFPILGFKLWVLYACNTYARSWLPINLRHSHKPISIRCAAWGILVTCMIFIDQQTSFISTSTDQAIGKGGWVKESPFIAKCLWNLGLWIIVVYSDVYILYIICISSQEITANSFPIQWLRRLLF